IVPLTAREHIVGAITLVSFARGYSHDDLALTQELGHRVALAVDNAQLYAEARAAVRVRDDVLAIVSHDLGNPLTSILSTTDHMLMKMDGGVAPERRPIERVQRAARRMSHLIRDLLDAASLETGTLSLECKATKLSRVLGDVIDQMQPLADARGLTLSVRCDDDLTVSCDRERIAQGPSNV